MPVMIATSDVRRLFHMEQALEQAELDANAGEPFLSTAFVAQLQTTYDEFYSLFRKFKKKDGERIELNRQRDEAVKTLSSKIRDLYLFCRRKYERGELPADLMNVYEIPRTAIRESYTQPGIWLYRAKLLLDGDAEWTEDHPSILLSPSKDEIMDAYNAAKTINTQVRNHRRQMSTQKGEFEAKRINVDFMLRKMRSILAGNAYQLAGPKLQELLRAYGYSFSSGSATSSQGQPETPAGQEPTGTEPTGNEPTGTEPTGNEPTGTEPTNEPPSNEPTGTEPGNNEPGGEPTQNPTGSETPEPTGGSADSGGSTGTQPTGNGGDTTGGSTPTTGGNSDGTTTTPPISGDSGGAVPGSGNTGSDRDADAPTQTPGGGGKPADTGQTPDINPPLDNGRLTTAPLVKATTSNSKTAVKKGGKPSKKRSRSRRR